MNAALFGNAKASSVRSLAPSPEESPSNKGIGSTEPHTQLSLVLVTVVMQGRLGFPDSSLSTSMLQVKSLIVPPASLT
jgi:hypothetical protein